MATVSWTQNRAFREALWQASLAVILLAFYLFYSTRPLDGDEHTYENFTNAIRDLIKNNNLLSLFDLYASDKFSNVTSLPGYFLLVGYAKVLFPASQTFRLINVIFLFFSGIVFDRCRRKIYTDTDPYQKWGFIFFPVSFTLAYLIFTDFPALFLVLSAFFLELKGLCLLSTLVLVAAFFVRQSIAPWILLIPLLVEFAPGRSLPAAAWTDIILKHLRRRWHTIVLLCGIAAFVILNNGFAMGDRNFHETGKFSIWNIINFYFFAGVFFLPSILAHLKAHIDNLSKFGWISAACLLAVLGIYYYGTKGPLHPYNGWLEHAGGFFIRNLVLRYQADSIIFTVISIVLITFGAMEINRGLSWRMKAVLTAGVIASLAPFNVIDIRYAIIPFMFYMLFRREEDTRIQVVQVSWLILISVTWFVGTKYYLWTQF